MPDQTPRLSLPYLMPSQAQKHVTHNEALKSLDLLVQLRIAGFDIETPPGSPNDGDTYALGGAPTGAWAGQGDQLAAWVDGGWVFFTPQDGFQAVDQTTGEIRVHQAGSWQSLALDTENLSGVGIGTTSDATNRLSVVADATLLNHAGTDHQLKLNKAADTDTGTMVFQTGFSGRAEMGLAGDDDFSLKVSPDGSAWNTALQADGTSGFVTTPRLSTGTIKVFEDSVSSITTPGASGFVMITMVDSLYPQSQHSGILVYDTGASPFLRTMVLGSAMVNLGAVALTGTTGTSGDTSISVQTGVLQIENRYSGTRRYSYTFLGGE